MFQKSKQEQNLVSVTDQIELSNKQYHRIREKVSNNPEYSLQLLKNEKVLSNVTVDTCKNYNIFKSQDITLNNV